MHSYSFVQSFMLNFTVRTTCLYSDGGRCLHFHRLSVYCIYLKLRLRVYLYSPGQNVVFVLRCRLRCFCVKIQVTCLYILSLSECYVCQMEVTCIYLHEVYRTGMSDKVSASLYRVHQRKEIHICVLAWYRSGIIQKIWTVHLKGRVPV